MRLIELMLFENGGPLYAASVVGRLRNIHIPDPPDGFEHKKVWPFSCRGAFIHAHPSTLYEHPSGDVSGLALGSETFPTDRSLCRKNPHTPWSEPSNRLAGPDVWECHGFARE